MEQLVRIELLIVVIDQQDSFTKLYNIYDGASLKKSNCSHIAKNLQFRSNEKREPKPKTESSHKNVKHQDDVH